MGRTRTGSPFGQPLPHRLWVLSAAFSPDGERFLTGGGYIFGGPGEARLWRTATREPIGPPMSFEGTVYAVAFSPDGRTFLVGWPEQAGPALRCREWEIGAYVRAPPGCGVRGLQSGWQDTRDG